MKLLRFNQDFIVEKLLKDSKYPLSKIQFKRCNEIIKINDLNNEKDKNKFIEKLDLLVKNGKINNIITMKYCKNEENKEKYKVHLNSDKLCFYSKENDIYEPLSSLNLFKRHFNGRTPQEDDQYLIKIKYPILPERIGKSTCSCFIIDEKNDLYISPYRQDTMHHSFITFCGDVLCAGLIFCEKGKILYIENRAGHYLPSPENILHFFKILKEKYKYINLIKLFHENFDIKRDVFSKCQTDLINKKEYGLNFFSFHEKTEQEKKIEFKLRNEIIEKYLSK